MADEKDDLIYDLFLTEEGRLRYENEFLRERVANHQVFRKSFLSGRKNRVYVTAPGVR